MRHTPVFRPEDWAARLSARQRRVIDPGVTKASAVLAPLFWQGGRLHLLFTKRSEHVTTHKGQISFPGGRVEPDDPSLEATALRECHEEIGLPPAQVRVVGPLDDITTLGGVCITPFLAMVPAGFAYVTDPREVTAVLEVPVATFLDPARLTTQTHILDDGRQRTIYFYDVGGEVVWGATARIVKQWLDLMAAELGCDLPDLLPLFGS
jgi:8-oxo-dGTP pyrophosphatase MutT (NUDIX family)